MAAWRRHSRSLFLTLSLALSVGALAANEARADDAGPDAATGSDDATTGSEAASTVDAATAVDAAAPPTTPCGKFDFSGGLSCKIEVSGGCSAQCTPIQFEAACTGGCSATSDTMCEDTCGTQCVAMCDPAALNCFVGCHAECDQPTTAECQQKHPGDAECGSKSKAQCDIHCKDSCVIAPSTCSEHCTKCCHGSCTTQVNFDCDFACFANVQGGCDVQCQRPEGAIFCKTINGQGVETNQYVNASDVGACISYLATQGVSVDVSARASATCSLSGCSDVTSSVKGCSTSPHSSPTAATTLAGFGGVGLTLLALLAQRARGRRRLARVTVRR